MKVVKDSITITMSSEDSEALQRHLAELHGHVEAYFAKKTEDTESGTPDAALMDAITGSMILVKNWLRPHTLERPVRW